jgi:quinol monooxygenase YgiN
MICRIYDVPGATLDQYDQVDQQVGSEKPDGVHAHIAGRTDDGFRVIEVWDSREHIDRYMESGLGQALQDAQIPEPTITEFEVHRLDWVN